MIDGLRWWSALLALMLVPSLLGCGNTDDAPTQVLSEAGSGDGDNGEGTADGVAAEQAADAVAVELSDESVDSDTAGVCSRLDELEAALSAPDFAQLGVAVDIIGSIEQTSVNEATIDLVGGFTGDVAPLAAALEQADGDLSVAANSLDPATATAAYDRIFQLGNDLPALQLLLTGECLADDIATGATSTTSPPTTSPPSTAGNDSYEEAEESDGSGHGSEALSSYVDADSPFSFEYPADNNWFVVPMELTGGSLVEPHTVTVRYGDNSFDAITLLVGSYRATPEAMATTEAERDGDRQRAETDEHFTVDAVTVDGAQAVRTVFAPNRADLVIGYTVITDNWIYELTATQPRSVPVDVIDDVEQIINTLQLEK